MALFSWIIRCIIVVSLRTHTADSTASSNKTVVTLNGCACSYDGKLFNIEPLQETDGNPRFTVNSTEYVKWSYAYNPCTPFKEGPPSPTQEHDCQEDVALCRWAQDDRKSYRTIGTQSSVKCGTDKLGNPQLEYISGFGEEWKSTVQLICDPSKEKKDDATFEVVDPDNFVFSVSHKCACGDGCPLDPTDSSPSPASHKDEIVIPVVSASVGVILLIPIAFVCFRCRSRRRRREAEERAQLLDQPNRLNQPNDVDEDQNDLPNPENNGGRNSANLSQRLPDSKSSSDITEPGKDKYGNRVKIQSE